MFAPLLRLARRAMLPLLGVALVAATGCEQGTEMQVVSETDEKQYQFAQQMQKEDHPDKALDAYLRVIRKRQGEAPESHLEAGQLFLNYKKDPVAAIYHFQEYLAAKPNSEEAPMVRQLIETARKDFARTLPGQPYAAEYERVDLLEQIKQLRAENENLKRQLANAQPVAVTGIPLDNFSTTPDSPRPAPAPARGTTLNQPIASVPPPPARGPAPSAPHNYVVKEHDTLSEISRKEYGTVARWREIYNANRDQLPTEKTILHPGMVLKIP